VRAIGWIDATGLAHRLVAKATGTHIHCVWWCERQPQQILTITNTVPRDITTEPGMFRVLRVLVRLTRDPALFALRERTPELDGTSRRPPWADVPSIQHPETVARRLRQQLRTRERQAALRARYRQRGTIQESTAAHASRVA
jgi:hypothetical protein